MKSIIDFYKHLDKCKASGNKLSKGKAVQYGLNDSEGFIDKLGKKKVGAGGFAQWWMDWNKGKPITVRVNAEDGTPVYGLQFANHESKVEQAVKVAPLTDQQKVEYDRKIRALISVKDEYKKKYDHALTELEQSEKRFDFLCGLREPLEFEPIVPGYSKSKSESIAVAQFSDLHIGEKVDPDTINGFNKYSPEIADKRCYNYFQNLLRLIDGARHDTKIETLFLHLGGDNITGYIHEELLQNNYLSPTEETQLAKKLIMRGLEFILNHGKFKKIIIQTNWGNHGRTTKKSTHSTGYKNSYEYTMYLDIMDYFKSTKEIVFNIQKSNIAYSPPLFEKVIRTGHGDTFNYNGGIGGLAVPLIKYVHRMNTQRQSDFDMYCHWHQRIRPIKNCVINGSIIGFTAYAQSLGCTPEPPMQNLLFIDKERGFTYEYPIFCD